MKPSLFKGILFAAFVVCMAFGLVLMPLLIALTYFIYDFVVWEKRSL